MAAMEFEFHAEQELSRIKNSEVTKQLIEREQLEWFPEEHVPKGLHVCRQGRVLCGPVMVRMVSKKVFRKWDDQFFVVDPFALKFYRASDDWEHGNASSTLSEFPFALFPPSSPLYIRVSRVRQQLPFDPVVTTKSAMRDSDPIYALKITVNDRSKRSSSGASMFKTRRRGHRRTLSSPASLLKAKTRLSYASSAASFESDDLMDDSMSVVSTASSRASDDDCDEEIGAVVRVVCKLGFKDEFHAESMRRVLKRIIESPNY